MLPHTSTLRLGLEQVVVCGSRHFLYKPQVNTLISPKFKPFETPYKRKLKSLRSLYKSHCHSTNRRRGLSWWLWALHACLIVPKFFQWGPSVDRGALYLVLAILSFLTHITSSKSSWPQSDCQISISVDVLASSALTCAFAAQHVKVQELIVCLGPHP